MPNDDLEALIRRHVVLGKRSPKGFEVVKCAVCNDYQERGGFKFEAGTVGYHCFNCGHSARYDPSINRRHVSQKLSQALTAFGIPEVEVKRCLFFNDRVYEQLTPAQKKLLPPTVEVPLPPRSTPILGDGSPWCEVAREYLRLRQLDWSTLPFFVSDDPSYACRLIIPHYYRGKLIYWQARALDESIQPRYKNPLVEKDNVCFNQDELSRLTDEPLFVNEGAFDALSIGTNAISLVGSSLSEFHLAELTKAATRRLIVFVIDKDRNGAKLANRALDEGWLVAVLPENFKDANDARIKLGQLWLVSYLTQSAKAGFEGKLMVRLSCK